jgi:hypothetical protein
MIEGERTRLLETRLLIGLTSPLLAFIEYKGGAKETIALFKDEMGNFFFPASSSIQIGTIFRMTDDTVYEVVDITAIHRGEEKCALQVRAENITSGAG